MLVIKLIVVAILACLSESKRHHRIIGGQRAPPGKFPYQVSVQIRNIHHCGGSIISNKYVLTAGHCVFRAWYKFSVLAGTTDWQNRDRSGFRYEIKKVVIHEEFTPSLINDIALLETTEKMTFREYIAPIALGKDFVGGDEEVILSGWGYTKNGGKAKNHLHCAKLKTVTNEECEKPPSQNTNLPITKGHICTLTNGGEGICLGDSGSALVNNERNKLVGIVSRGTSTNDEKCATGFPDVFTRVSEYVDWVEERTKQAISNK